jgi:predicted secreted protein
MAKGSGNLIFIKWGTGDAVGLTDKSIDFTADGIPVTNQQSCGMWAEYVAGNKRAKIAFSGVYDKASAIGMTSMFAELLANSVTPIAFKIGEKTTGLVKYTGSGFLSGLTCNGPMTAAASYSGEITVTGPPSQVSTAW